MTDSEAELAAGRLGRTVGGRWRLENVLGVGGMAAVYTGRDGSGAIAAIKILHPEMGVRREVRERFLREGYVANRIGHPGVVQALEHGETGDEVFLAMELLAGETLRARVKRHGRLPVGEVLDFADQILDVLAVAHDKGIVHRDLKPDNLFVSPEGRIKILDFGLARVLDGVPTEHRTRTGVALGTLAYMAPEQALGRRAEIDGRVDIFALGATMFRVLSGRRVHEAESEAELLMAMASRPAPPLAVAVPGVSPAIASVVDLALAFSRDARYPDARTMQSDVRSLRQGQLAAYASARLSSREEPTRAEAPPTTSQRTQPLSATMGSHVPGTSSTMQMPMPVASLGVIAQAPGYGVPAGAAPQGPPSVRTEPFAAHGAGAAMPGPASFATTMPSTQPPFVVPAFATSQPALTPPKKSPRGVLVAVLALAFVGVALAGGAGAWYALSGSNTDSAATPVGNAPSQPEGVAPPANVVSPPPVPAKAEPEADTPGAAPRKGSSKKPNDAVAEPSATASASDAPPPAPSATALDPAPPAPSSTGAAAPAPPATAPAAPPSAAAPAPTSPPAPAPASDAKGPPPAKRRRGRN